MTTTTGSHPLSSVVVAASAVDPAEASAVVALEEAALAEEEPEVDGNIVVKIITKSYQYEEKYFDHAHHRSGDSIGGSGCL